MNTALLRDLNERIGALEQRAAVAEQLLVGLVVGVGMKESVCTMLTDQNARHVADGGSPGVYGPILRMLGLETPDDDPDSTF